MNKLNGSRLVNFFPDLTAGEPFPHPLRLPAIIKLHGQPIIKPFKQGRNDKCPCGSGKKFKLCCWSKTR